VFIGPQSSGKSTIAKIISFCSWLEKNKHELDGSYLFSKSVIDRMVSFHRMEGYLSDQSQLFYQGENLAFAYNCKENEFPQEFKTKDYNIVHNDENETFFFSLERRSNPKVLYIPAERNFVSSVQNLRKYDESDDSINNFVFDWHEAKGSYAKESALALIHLGMKYFCENGTDYIQISEDNSIRLRNASSGLQSVTPLLVVADYMTRGLYEKERPFSVEEQDVLNDLLHKLATENFPSDNVANLKRRLSGFLQGKVYTHTQFIIEEPEQNLFPSTQKDLLFSLLADINHGKSHRMVITTHSPYILYALNNSMLAYLVKDSVIEGIRSEIDCMDAAFNPKNVSVWQIEDGCLMGLDGKENTTIQDGKGLIRKNYFDSIMGSIMKDFNNMVNFYDAG